MDDAWTHEKSDNVSVVSSREGSADRDESFWLRIEVDFDPNAYSELLDVLYTNLETRQKEWHDLLMPGGTVTSISENFNLCHFAYSSPWPMGPRDCLYVAQGEFKEDEFKLFYWTVDDESIPTVEKGVRIDFQAAHWIRRNVDNVLKYVYVQHSDPKIHLPDFILCPIQANVLLGEGKGLKRAVCKPKSI